MDKSKKTTSVLAVILSVLLLSIPVIFFWLIAVFNNLVLHFLIPLIGILLVVRIGFIRYGSAKRKSYKKTIVILSAFIVFLGGSLCLEHWYQYKIIPSITIGQQFDYYTYYMPFTNSKRLARLETEANLRFSAVDKLPVVDGSQPFFPLYASFVEAVYPPDCNVEDCVHFNSTAKAYTALIDGKNDVIFVVQPSKVRLAQAEASGVEFNMYPIGVEAFVFLVNGKNPVSNLTIRQIKDIYTGKITNWKSLGWNNRSIRPYQREEGSGSQAIFLSLMGKDVELLPPEMHREVDGLGSIVKIVSSYENHANAIGFSFRYYVENMTDSRNFKILKLNGIAASEENIRNKSYPCSGNFYAVTVKGRESENTCRLI